MLRHNSDKSQPQHKFQSHSKTPTENLPKNHGGDIFHSFFFTSQQKHRSPLMALNMVIPIPSSPRGASRSFFKFSSEPDCAIPARSVLEPKVPLPRRKVRMPRELFGWLRMTVGFRPRTEKKKCGKKNEKSEKCAHLLIAGSSLASSKVSTTVQQWGNVGSRTSSLQLFGQIL